MLYNAIIADPTPLQAAMKDYAGNPFVGDGPCYFDLASNPGLDRQDYDLSTSKIRESLRGEASVLQLELKQPLAGFLVAAGGKFLFVWSDENCPAGKGRVVCFGMIDALPGNIGSADGRVDIQAYCRRLDWQRNVKDEIKSAVAYDRLFYDQDSGPTTADLMAASNVVPTIDRRTMQVVLRQSFAAIDVDSSKPAGNVSQNGVVAYDVTDYALMNGFALRKGNTVPIVSLATKLQIAWSQFAAGLCDLSGIVTTTLGALNGGQTTLPTYTPNDFKGSFPKAGQGIGVGWVARTVNLTSTDQVHEFDRSPAEAPVAGLMAQQYALSDTTDGDTGQASVLVPNAIVGLQPGAGTGFVASYDYTQTRRETLVMKSTLDIDSRFMGGRPAMTGAKVALADPTLPVTGNAWLPNTPYAQDDIAWYGGLRQTTLDDQVSGDTFDQSLWEAEQPDPTDVPANVSIYSWFPNTDYAAGAVVWDPAAPTDFYYRNTTGISPLLNGTNIATFNNDKANWTQGPAPHQSLTTLAWQYLASDRGKTSTNHLDQRQYATLLNAAKCIEASLRLRYDDLLDAATGYRAIDLTVGKCLRVRTQSLTSGVNEVIGVVTDLEIAMGQNGAGAVSVTLGLIPGNGMTSANATTVLGTTAAAYTYGAPRVPIDVTQLGNAGYAVRECTVTGASDEAQQNLISQALDDFASEGGSITNNIINALGENNVNRFKLLMLPLTQEGLIPLVHPTMIMKPKAAPKNIEFAA